MANNNSITLLNAVSSTGEGTAQEVMPDRNGQSKLYTIEVSGTLNGGSVGLKTSLDDGSNYNTHLLNGIAFAQSVTGSGYQLQVDMPMKVKGALSGSSGTDTSVTLKLFSSFKAKKG